MAQCISPMSVIGITLKGWVEFFSGDQPTKIHEGGSVARVLLIAASNAFCFEQFVLPLYTEKIIE